MKDDSIFWNKVAAKYSLKPVPNQENYQRKLELTRELFTQDSNILEIGCGTGTTALLHAPHVKKITATDFSSEMIKLANEKAKVQGQTNIKFLQESVHEMDYPENEFDIIMAHSILHLIKNREIILEKIFKSLKPGGYFVTSTGCIGGIFKTFKPLWYIGFQFGKLPYLAFFTKDSFAKEVSNSGLEIVNQWEPTKVDTFIIAKRN